MATTIDQANATLASADTGAAISVSKPSGASSGEVACVVIYANGAANTITDNNGSRPFTADSVVDEYAGGGITASLSVLYRTLDGGEGSTFDFTLGTSDRWTAVAFIISNPNSTLQDADSTVGNFTAVNNADFPDITAANAGSLHVIIVGHDSSGSDVSAPVEDYTTIKDHDSALSTGQALYVGYKAIASSGLITGVNAAWGGAQNGHNASVLLRDESIVPPVGGSGKIIFRNREYV